MFREKDFRVILFMLRSRRKDESDTSSIHGVGPTGTASWTHYGGHPFPSGLHTTSERGPVNIYHTTVRFLFVYIFQSTGGHPMSTN